MKHFLMAGGAFLGLMFSSGPLTGVARQIRGIEINTDLVQSVRVLVTGAPIHGANGLAFDRHGKLHIASVLGREIVVMDPTTGRILDRLGPEAGVESPDDLTFGPSGSMYEDDLFWTGFFSGEVGRLTPAGVKITAGQVYPGVNPITFSDDVRLFVAHDFFGLAGLYEIDPEGIAPPDLLDPNFYNLNGFDFGPDGLLYGPIFQEKILRIDVDSGPVPLWSEDVLNPFPSVAVKFDATERLHAIHGDTVVRINPGTGATETVVRISPFLDNLAFDSEGSLFVSDWVNGTIYRVLPNGDTRIISRRGMIFPGGVAVLPRSHGGEAVFVADVHMFREFNGRTGQVGVEAPVFGSASTIAPMGDDLLVSSWFDNSVAVRDGATLEVMGAPDHFAVPMNAIPFQSGIAVCELGTGSVVRGDHSTIASGLFVPTGLAAIGGNLYVADWAQGAVFQIVEDGAPVALTPVAIGLSNPEGLAVDRDGKLLVVESAAGRLSRIDPGTGEVTMVAQGLEIGAMPPPNAPPSWILNGVAVGSAGHIYVTGGKGNVLYKFKQHPRRARSERARSWISRRSSRWFRSTD